MEWTLEECNIMNNKEFVLWLRGFMDAIDGIPTQAQWNIIKDKINTVVEATIFPIGVPNSTDPFPTWKGPHIDPYNPFKITCDTNELIFTATSGSNSTYTIPSGITTNGNTTWTNMPTGVNVSYTLDNKK